MTHDSSTKLELHPYIIYPPLYVLCLILLVYKDETWVLFYTFSL